MEFGWSATEVAYRERVRDLLAELLPDDWAEMAVHGPGSQEQTDFSKAFCPKLNDAGLLIPHWPREHGGEDGAAWEQFILGEELWAAGEPRGPQYMNVNWIGPVLMRYGTPEQQSEFLPPIRDGQAIWCQGFSEPSAGSDLAALATKAVPVPGGYEVTGAKVWTSYAGLADWCFLLARTSNEGKGGIVILLVKMDSPGIQVKEIPALIGRGDIHELFFDSVFVPEARRLGEVGQAWEIIRFGLQNERIGIPRYAFSERMLDRAVERLKAQGRFDDPFVQERLGRAWAYCQAARMMVYRVVHDRALKREQTAYGNLARWAVVRADQASNDALTELAPDGLLGADSLQQAHHQRAIAAGIAAGAAEIQLNLAARHHLNLPSEK